MPLSEHEQKLLDQLEQQLNAEDPHFAQSMHSETTSSTRDRGGISVRYLVLGIVIAVVGLVGVLAGVASKQVVVGVVGFVVMGLGVYVATLRGSSTKGHKRGSAHGAPKSAGSSSSFMRRLEEKWEERNNRG